MIAKVKATGEIVKGTINDKGLFIQETEPKQYRFINEIEILEENTQEEHEEECIHKEFKTNIDWEQRRYEIAKEMLHAIYLDDGNEKRNDKSDLQFEYKSLQGSAKEAVRFADALIEELKKTI